jgi:NAD(P)-dependent dehydrogenase (short-subunit alcohol dehydrogenase family)
VISLAGERRNGDDALRDAAARIEQQFGGIDILFASAGIQAFKPILDMEDEDWYDQIDVNLTGTDLPLRISSRID